MQLIANSKESLSNAIGEIRTAWDRAKFLRIVIKEGTGRSLSQSALSHVWYEQIARELREDTPLGVKCFCKLHYGVPIMRAESEEFRELYDLVIKSLTYERKLAAMSAWPVTSLMSKDQLSQYLTAMQDGYAGRVQLEFPKDEEGAT